MTDAKLFRGIIQRCRSEVGSRCVGGNVSDDALAAFLADELAAIQDIRRAVNDVAGDRLAEIQRHGREMAGIDEALAMAQERCKHWTATYHPDPSGGRDSSRTCDQCGKELRGGTS